MRKRKLALLLALVALGVLAVVASRLVAYRSRKAQDFAFTDPSGAQIELSSFKGKVVVVEFSLTDCPHCWRVAEMIRRLDTELGPRGFQPIGIAFDNGISGPAVSNFVRKLDISYPVGYASSRVVDGVLRRAPTERMMVPQIVVFDRDGVVRARSRPIGEQNLENEDYMRSLIVSLLGTSVPTAPSKRAAF